MGRRARRAGLHRRLHRSRRAGLAAAPIVVAASSTSLTDRAARRDQGRSGSSAPTSAPSAAPGLVVIVPLSERRPERPRAQLRDQSAEGQRRRGQSGGDRGDRRLAGGGHGGGDVRRRRLRRTSSRCRPSPRCATSRPPIRTTIASGQGTSLRGSTDTVAGRARAGDGRADRDRRRGDRRGAHQPSRLRLGDRPGDAAPPAGQRRRRRPLPDRRRRRRHGRHGARPDSDERGIVELDEERKAAMVSNLLVVLCGEQPATPFVNTGSLYT